MLYELVETIRLEIQGLEELMEMCTSVTSLEVGHCLLLTLF